MMSPRKFAKAVLFHTRRAQIRTLAAPRQLSWLRRRLHLPSNETYQPLHDTTPLHAKVIPLDPGATFARPLPFLPNAPQSAVQFFSSRTIERTEPTFVLELQEGLAWGHPTGGIFTAEGKFVPALTHDPAGADSHTVWRRLHFPEPKRLRGRTLYLVTPEATDNFHHWLIDLLPRLGLVRRAGYVLAEFDHVIVNHAGRKYQLATLAQLGLPQEKMIEAQDSVFLRCDSLVIPSLKANHQTLPAADLSFLREAFLGSAPSAPKDRRIFLSRSDAAFRRLRNEAEFLPFLHEHGFEIISPAGLDFTAQAKLFAEASIIAGPAGAAFANLVFAARPAQVIELVPPQWLAAFHWMISARAGLHHTVILGNGNVMTGVPDSSARQVDLEVPLESFSSALARPLATLAQERSS